MRFALHASSLSLLLWAVGTGCTSTKLDGLGTEQLSNRPPDAGSALPGLESPGAGRGGATAENTGAGGGMGNSDAGGVGGAPIDASGGAPLSTPASGSATNVPATTGEGGMGNSPPLATPAGMAGMPEPLPLPTCTDELKNGAETGVDCGANCSGCTDGMLCLTEADCQSERCDAPANRCGSCTDGVANGDETAIDCGGTDCDPCAVAAACTAAVDCTDGAVCVNNQCTSCGNGLVDLGEACDLPAQPNVCTPTSCQFQCVEGCTCATSEVSGRAKAYAFCPSSATWDDAKSLCEGASFALVRVESQAEIDFVRGQASIVSLGVFWYGASDSASEGNFVWIGGDPVGMTFWSQDEPSGNVGENCVSSFGSTALWSDAVCTSFFAYVCERPD